MPEEIAWRRDQGAITFFGRNINFGSEDHVSLTTGFDKLSKIARRLPPA